MASAARLRPTVARRIAPLLLLLAGCATVITPAAVREADWPEEARSEILRRWQAAVDTANEFLASDANRSLPQGLRLTLDEQSGMRFQDAAHRDRPLRVANTWWGDLCVSMGFAAQERSWGFVVGDRGEGPQVVAHSFFYTTFGMKSIPYMAELILHEMAHVVHHTGTVDPFQAFGYYLLAIAHGGSPSHPAERAPYATSSEFLNWYQAQP